VLRDAVDHLDERQRQVQQHRHLAASADAYGTSRRLRRPLTRRRRPRGPGARRGGTLELRGSTQPAADVLGHMPVPGVLTEEVDFEAVQETRPTEHVPARTANDIQTH